MQIVVTSVESPVYADAKNETVNLTVKFDHIAQPVPFLASPVDLEVHGRDLLRRAKAGEFGPIAPYRAPKRSITEKLRLMLRDVLLKMLKA